LLLFSSLLIISSLPINHHDYHPPSGFGSPSCPCGTHASLTTLGTPQYSVHHSTVTVNGPSSRPTGLPQTPADAHVSPAVSDSRRHGHRHRRGCTLKQSRPRPSITKTARTLFDPFDTSGHGSPSNVTARASRPGQDVKRPTCCSMVRMHRQRDSWCCVMCHGVGQRVHVAP
jgi:hypothetical protein